MTGEDEFLVDGDHFPWSDVEASRQNQPLQRRHPVAEGERLYASKAKACPKCNASADWLSWFYFESPEETWELLCRRAGWITVCDD